MRYAMFICGDADHTEEDAAAAPGIEDWFTYANARSQYIQGVRLQDVDQARTVRVRDGELLVTDGPYTEAKEWIAGFGIIECATFEEALELARRNPMAWEGRIELRPIHSMGGPND
ncbi:MAG: YciI family protein [Candidatus Limnocylindrales bacterium]